MPLPNPDRPITEEVQLARRVAYEREKRGWTYEGLAKRMTEAGCAVQPSAIYKIEKQGRRIVVEELVGFARVFGVPVDRLLLPAEVARQEAIVMAWKEWEEAYEIAVVASGELHAAAEILLDAIGDDPALTESIAELASQAVARGLGRRLMPDALTDRLGQVLSTFPVAEEGDEPAVSEEEQA